MADICPLKLRRLEFCQLAQGKLNRLAGFNRCLHFSFNLLSGCGGYNQN